MNEAQRITEWVEQKKESAIALARAVWGFAEPNWRETQSAAAISAALEAEGFALERRPCGMETAFVATWGGEGPVIAFLGEYDALPDTERALILAASEHLPLYGNRRTADLGPDEASAAHRVFALLRQADDDQITRVFSETYPESGVGLAVMNRMARAAGFDIVQA